MGGFGGFGWGQATRSNATEGYAHSHPPTHNIGNHLVIGFYMPASLPANEPVTPSEDQESRLVCSSRLPIARAPLVRIFMAHAAPGNRRERGGHFAGRLRPPCGVRAPGGWWGGATSRGLCPAGPSSFCRGYQCALVSGRANVRVVPLGVRQTDGGLGNSQPSFGIRARPWALGTRVGPYVRTFALPETSAH